MERGLPGVSLLLWLLHHESITQLYMYVLFFPFFIGKFKTINF